MISDVVHLWQRTRLRTESIRTACISATLATGLLLCGPAHAQETPGTQAPPAAEPGTAPPSDVQQVPILYLKQLRDKNPPLSLLDLPPADDGVAGAKLGIADNNTTGQFTKQNFTLDVVESANVDDLIKAALEKGPAGSGFVVADMEPDALLKLADALAGRDAVVMNVGNADDSVREENCRANVLHIAPSRSMLADALGQYLAWKRWNNWFLIVGPQPEDKLYAEALKRAAKRFGSKIVEERESADPWLHARRQRARHRHGLRRRFFVWRVSPLSHLVAAPGDRYRRPRGIELASGTRALGWHAIPESLQAPCKPPHASPGL